MGAWCVVRGAEPREQVWGVPERGVWKNGVKGQREKRGRAWWPEVRCLSTEGSGKGGSEGPEIRRGGEEVRG